MAISSTTAAHLAAGAGVMSSRSRGDTSRGAPRRTPHLGIRMILIHRDNHTWSTILIRLIIVSGQI